MVHNVFLCSFSDKYTKWRTPTPVASRSWWHPHWTSKSPHHRSTTSQRSLPLWHHHGLKVLPLPQHHHQHQLAQQWLAEWEICLHHPLRSLMVFALFTWSSFVTALSYMHLISSPPWSHPLLNFMLQLAELYTSLCKTVLQLGYYCFNKYFNVLKFLLYDCFIWNSKSLLFIQLFK